MRGSFAAAFRVSWAKGGARELYKGLGATLALDIPFALVQFPVFEALRFKLASLRHTGADTWRGPTHLDAAIAGALAGALAGAITTPLDVVRTRHVLRQHASTHTDGTVRRSFVATARDVLAREGPRALMRGLVARTAYMSAGGVLYLGTYSVCHRALNLAAAGGEHAGPPYVGHDGATALTATRPRTRSVGPG